MAKLNEDDTGSGVFVSPLGKEKESQKRSWLCRCGPFKERFTQHAVKRKIILCTSWHIMCYTQL